MEVKGVRRKTTQILDDLRNRGGYWELKEEAEDRKTTVKIEKQQFIDQIYERNTYLP